MNTRHSLQDLLPDELVIVNKDGSELTPDTLDEAVIGSGMTGKVVTCKYTGSDPDVIRVANNGLVAVKILNADITPNKNEEQVLNNLQTLIATPAPRTAEVGGVRVMEIVAYQNEPTDLKKFLETRASSLSNNPNALGQPLKTALDRIFAQIILNQNNLHENNVLHLDTAPRNFLVTTEPGTNNLVLKITDFGLSVPTIMPKEGEAYHNQQAPVRIVDQEGYNGRAGVKTDIYARKMAMLEVIALAGGLDEIPRVKLYGKDLTQGDHDLIKKFISKYPDEKNIKVPRNNEALTHETWGFLRIFSQDKNDEFFLKQSLDAVRDKVNAKADPKVAAELNEVLIRYEAYLTTMPQVELRKDERDDVQNARKADIESFNAHTPVSVDLNVDWQRIDTKRRESRASQPKAMTIEERMIEFKDVIFKALNKEAEKLVKNAKEAGLQDDNLSALKRSVAMSKDFIKGEVPVPLIDPVGILTTFTDNYKKQLAEVQKALEEKQINDLNQAASPAQINSASTVSGESNAAPLTATTAATTSTAAEAKVAAPIASPSESPAAPTSFKAPKNPSRARAQTEGNVLRNVANTEYTDISNKIPSESEKAFRESLASGALNKPKSGLFENSKAKLPDTLESSEKRPIKKPRPKTIYGAIPSKSSRNTLSESESISSRTSTSERTESVSNKDGYGPLGLPVNANVSNVTNKSNATSATSNIAIVPENKSNPGIFSRAVSFARKLLRMPEEEPKIKPKLPLGGLSPSQPEEPKIKPKLPSGGRSPSLPEMMDDYLEKLDKEGLNTTPGVTQSNVSVPQAEPKSKDTNLSQSNYDIFPASGLKKVESDYVEMPKINVPNKKPDPSEEVGKILADFSNLDNSSDPAQSGNISGNIPTGEPEAKPIYGNIPKGEPLSQYDILPASVLKEVKSDPTQSGNISGNILKGDPKSQDIESSKTNVEKVVTESKQDAENSLVASNNSTKLLMNTLKIKEDPKTNEELEIDKFAQKAESYLAREKEKSEIDEFAKKAESYLAREKAQSEIDKFAKKAESYLAREKEQSEIDKFAKKAESYLAREKEQSEIDKFAQRAESYLAKQESRQEVAQDKKAAAQQKQEQQLMQKINEQLEIKKFAEKAQIHRARKEARQEVVPDKKIAVKQDDYSHRSRGRPSASRGRHHHESVLEGKNSLFLNAVNGNESMKYVTAFAKGELKLQQEVYGRHPKSKTHKAFHQLLKDVIAGKYDSAKEVKQKIQEIREERRERHPEQPETPRRRP